MTPSITLTPSEAHLAAGCIRRYLLSLLGVAAEGRVNRLYGDRLVKEMAKKARKGTPLVEILKEPEQAKRLTEMVSLYGRIYRQATPMDVQIHPDTGKPCSYDQWVEATDNWLQR